MINIIYGVKGSGKTKRIIDAANDRARTTKGSIIYVTDCADHSGEVDNSIRFIDINRYGRMKSRLCALSRDCLRATTTLPIFISTDLPSLSRKTFRSWKTLSRNSTG